tara:strand:+ start:260 stop:403 length:144 start_codon:yes stop_codon:yes gene_type:complete
MKVQMLLGCCGPGFDRIRKTDVMPRQKRPIDIEQQRGNPPIEKVLKR